MADYGRDVAFGIFASPASADAARTIEVAEAADRGGLELIGVQDHPYQSRYLDTWSLLAVLLSRTQRVHVFPDVASLPLRPPAVMAKAAASLDVLSGGRFEMGLGAGAFWEAVTAMGGPARTPRQAGEALAEAIDVIRLMWSGQRGLRYSGKHYRLAGVHSGPRPVHDIGLWLGVSGPRMLSLVGRAADGWVPSASYVPPSVLPGMHARIDDAAEAAGRAPSDIRRLYNVFGAVMDGPSRGPFEGPPEQWVDTLTELTVAGGMDTYMFGPAGDDVAQVRRFIDDVVPRVRESVAAARA